MIEFEANPDYFRGRPRMGRVVLKFGDPAIRELVSGNVDAIPWVEELDLLKLQGDPRFHVSYGLEVEGELLWTAKAEERLKKVPSFVRGMLSKRVETYARARRKQVEKSLARLRQPQILHEGERVDA